MPDDVLRLAAGSTYPEAALTPGPVTAAMRVMHRKRSRTVMVALRGWPLLPALVLLRPALAGSARFTSYASQVLGGDAVLCLLACLTVTPLLSLAPCNIARLRFWYGVWMFTLGSAGLAIALAMTAGPVAQRAAGNSVNWTGTAIVVLLLPMALTANRWAQKRLGREWKRWQRLGVWTVWGVTLLHLAALHSWVYAAALWTATVPLALLRSGGFRQRVKAWRADGYSAGGMWLAMFAVAVVYAAAAVTLTGLEVAALARAAALAPVS